MNKVLLAEDEEMILKSLQFTIDWTRLGCVVCAAARNGRQGIEMIREHEPDIVITDIRMPFVDGIAMLEETHGDFDYETIIMSGYEEFSYAKKAISLGVSQYLLKPVDERELEEAILSLNRKLEERRKLRLIESGAEGAGAILSLPEGDKPYRSERVNLMVRFVRENYGKRVSIKELSDAMELSVPYLQANFKGHTGLTFNDFLNRYRVQQAVRLMQSTNLRIYEIAQEVGIPDYKYFNLVFKKYIGCSPSRFMGLGE